MKSLLLGVVLTLAATAASAQSATIYREESTGSIRLSPDQRTIIRRDIVRERAAPRTEIEVDVGADVPNGVELRTFSDDVISQVPTYRAYKYFQVGDRVVIVDSSSNRIVEILD